MCESYNNVTISDGTMRCILQTVAGNPIDGLQDYTIYFISLVISIILIYGIFSIFMIVAKIMRNP